MPVGNGQNSQHWSADFVQHLRAVHFSLIAVCVALIGAVVSVKPKEVATALAQLTEIRSAVGNWTREVKLGVLGGIRHTADGPRIVLNGVSYMLSLDANFPGDPNHPLPPGFRRKLEESLETPASFSNFCNAWDTLHNLPKLVIPDQTRLLDTVVIRKKDGSKTTAKYQPGADATAETVLVTTLTDEDREAISAFNFTKTSYGYSWYMGDDRIILPVEGLERQIDGQGVVIRAHPAWKPGLCRESFAALVKQADNSSDKSFPGIASYLSEAAAKEKTDSYTVFGMEFPVESASRWGILLIIGIQLYLWINLHEVSPRIKPDDPGWDVAWIGVYKSLPARSLFIALTLVLPLIAIIVLSDALITADQVFGRIYTYTAAASSLVLSVLIINWAPQHWKKELPGESTTSAG
jgi:hypothetical protein